MNEKVIYNNQLSKVIAEYSGDIITLKQYLDGELIGEVSLYVDELEDALTFVRSETNEQTEK